MNMQEQLVSIGEAARLSGVAAKTIRYYEEIGLVLPTARGENGYRAYGGASIQMLRFLNRARSLGFSIKDCRALLSLYQDRQRSSADVKLLAEAHLSAITEKIEALESLHRELAHLVDACAGDHRPDCPILDGLAGDDTAAGEPH